MTDELWHLEAMSASLQTRLPGFTCQAEDGRARDEGVCRGAVLSAARRPKPLSLAAPLPQPLMDEEATHIGVR